ncbi:hypothetical protein Vretimale_9799 [Volvox reticuliferus]|uniref:Band 7 domain-containing protein n=1 Tax=Volvox reticuliferus TaxID=1737510 RepID=A0A8J4GEJ4_9CHLO|nr:hypothetical protein Vretifemale_13586 [Volvox reticuliferus]GIM05335.1 hypothetical protein Vretimale_9799 [Volvox reticuliferus]
MRSELGKIMLDKTFEEREALNHNIVRSINEAAEVWGLQCMGAAMPEVRDQGYHAARGHRTGHGAAGEYDNARQYVCSTIFLYDKAISMSWRLRSSRLSF